MSGEARYRLFISYSHDDEVLRRELDQHLALLRREGAVRIWHDREIGAGEEWRGQIDEELEAADLILLLVSASFIASDYCFDVETTRALERHRLGEARVIPVIVRTCDWQTAPFAELQALPTGAKPVKEWASRDEAWTEVAKGLRKAIAELRGHPLPPAGDHHGRKPRYGDDEIRGLSLQLKELYRRRKDLTVAGGSTVAVEGEILDVRRLLRKGPQLRAGEFLGDGRYELIEPVGQGGFATVWRAWDTDAEEQVAVKVLHGHLSEDRSKRERFFRGARKMAELTHPHIVRVLEQELADDGWRFFVMEFVGRRNFEQAVLGGELTLAERLKVLLQVGDALLYAHEHGIVHRDVKPSNILLDERGGAKLTDFDLVRAQDTTGLTATRAMMGTVQFAAPEALISAAEASPATDVYSFGSTAVFAVSGKRLPAWYFHRPAEVIAELDCGEELKHALRRATAFEVEERSPSVAELCRALEAAALPDLSAQPAAAEVGVETEAPAVRALLAPDFPVRTKDRFAAWEKKRLGPGRRVILGVLLVILAIVAGPGIVSWLSPDPASAGGDSPSPPGVAVELPKPGSREPGALWEGPLGMSFRYVPAGKFMMGSPETEPGRDDDEVQHEVKLTHAFWMSETEVTQGQWRQLTSSEPSYFESCGKECPVERVNWYEAAKFANQLSEREGLAACYVFRDCTGTPGSGCVSGERYCAGDYSCKTATIPKLDCEGYRLPTEAEWEYATRAGESASYWTGDDLTPAQANYGSGKTVEVRSFDPNPWGLYEVHGNVWEWVWDWKANYPALAIDPQGPDTGSNRVVRGGSWDYGARYCRSAYRLGYAPGYRSAYVGFRLVRTAP